MTALGGRYAARRSSTLCLARGARAGLDPACHRSPPSMRSTGPAFAFSYNQKTLKEIAPPEMEFSSEFSIWKTLAKLAKTASIAVRRKSSRTLHDRRPDWAIDSRGRAAGAWTTMASALERELAKVRLGSGALGTTTTAPAPVSTSGAPALAGKPPASLARGGVRASVLYDARQAANIGVETLLDRAENGMAPPLLLNPTLETTASDGDRLTPQLHHLCLPMLS